MKTIRKQQIDNIIVPFLLLLACCMAGCSESDKEPVSGNPVLESYAPETGKRGTELMIKGSGFGNSAVDVQVWVNDAAAEVLSVSPTRIYALVPDAAGSGVVKVAVRGTELNASTPFTFEYSRNIYTYSGSGTAVTVDGTLAQASFNRPYWLTYDKKDDALFVLEEGRKVRRIKDGKVETIASLEGSINNPRSITMSLSSDTIFISNDNAANYSNIAVAILTRDTDFKVQKDYVPSSDATRFLNFAGIHPISGELIVYSWLRKLYKWNKNTSSVELLADLSTFTGTSDDFYANFCFSPDGETIYMVIKYPYIGILKAPYNKTAGAVTGSFTLLAGTGGWGSANGTGAEASFDQPAQAMVTTDGNLYIAEKFNHWVRQVTPEGVVTTYAGDGGAGNQGFRDGDRSAAKFNQPEGIAMDNAGNIYVADLENNRIRIIKSE